MKTGTRHMENEITSKIPPNHVACGDELDMHAEYSVVEEGSVEDTNQYKTHSN
jgi:hypothetical protein